MNNNGKRTLSGTSYGAAYEKGYDLTVRFLLSRGVPVDSAKEAAQAAWAKGWERRDTLRNPKMVVTWVNSIALNSFRNRFRKESVEEQLPELSQPGDSKITNIDIEKVLPRCKPRDQVLLRQHYFEGYTSKELAELHGCRPVAVRVRLLRARKQLRHMLKSNSENGAGSRRTSCANGASSRSRPEKGLTKENS